MAYGAEDRKQSGSITGTSSTVDISKPAAGTVAIQVTGTFTGTIQFQGTVNESTYKAIPATRKTTSPITAYSFAVVDPSEIYIVDAAGLRTVRVACTAYTSGTLTVTVLGSEAAAIAAGVAGVGGSEQIGIDNGGTVTYYPNVVMKSEVLLARAAYTSTQTITPVTNYGFNALEILIRVHTAVASETLTWGLNQILGVGNTPTATMAICTTQVINSGGFFRQWFSPFSNANGASGDPGSQASPKIHIPPSFNVLITHSASGSWNYEVLAYWYRV